MTMEVSRGRRGRKKENYYLICEGSGGQQKVPINNGVKEAALEEIVLQAGAHGVGLVDET